MTIDLPELLPYRDESVAAPSEIPRDLLMRLTIPDLRALLHHIARRIGKPVPQIGSNAKKNAIADAVVALASSAGQTVAYLFPKYPKIGSFLMHREFSRHGAVPSEHALYRFAQVEAIELHPRKLRIKLRLTGWREDDIRAVSAAPRPSSDQSNNPFVRNGHDVDAHNTVYTYGLPAEPPRSARAIQLHHLTYPNIFATTRTIQSGFFFFDDQGSLWERWDFKEKPVKYEASYRHSHGRCTTKKCLETRHRLLAVAALSRRLPTEVAQKIMSTVNRR